MKKLFKENGCTKNSRENKITNMWLSCQLWSHLFMESLNSQYTLHAVFQVNKTKNTNGMNMVAYK
jgi:hypothetical protein